MNTSRLEERRSRERGAPEANRKSALLLPWAGMMGRIAALLSVALVAHAALPNMNDYAQGVVVDTGDAVASGSRPLIEMPLPDAVYEVTTSAQLSDVRVFNSAGEPAPHALCPQDDAGLAAEVEIPAPVFALHEARKRAAAETQVEMRTSSGTQVRVQADEGDRATPDVGAHVLDVRDVKDMIGALQLDWRSTDGASEAQIRISASNDLEAWTPVASATLLSARSGDAELQRRRVELPVRHYKYLRVERADGGAALDIPAATAFATRGWVHVQEPVWFAATRAPAHGEASIEHVSSRLAPVQYARLRMPVDNSSLYVTLQSRADAQSNWIERWRGEVYAYVDGAERRENPPATFRPTDDPHWRVLLPKGAAPSLAPPVLELGYFPARLQFLKQGRGPYTVAFGSRRAAPPAVAPCNGLLADVSPERRRAMTEMGYAGAVLTLGGEAALKPSPQETPTRVIVLWAVLIVGVGLLAAMALSLLKRVRT